MEIGSKFKKLNSGFRFLLVFWFGLMFLKFILAFIPYMQQRETFLLQTYQSIRQPAEAELQNYIFGKGILKRWLSSTHSYPEDMTELPAYFQKQIEQLGWHLVKTNKHDYYEFAKQGARLHLRFYWKGDKPFWEKNKINEINKWSIHINYDNNWI